MSTKKLYKYRDFILLTIGTLLIILSLCLLLYDKFELLKSNVYDEIALEKYKENNKEENKSSNDYQEITNQEENDNVEVNEVTDESVKPIKQEDKKKIEKEYIGYLEIKKINLRQGLVSKTSYYNNVNRNIQMLSTSSYPDKAKGNVILAAHSGTSSISYFKNLYKLVVGDEAKIYYKNNTYTYKIVDIYNVLKTGNVDIHRDTNKSCLTLITCTKDSKTEQTIYILELVSKEANS